MLKCCRGVRDDGLLAFSMVCAFFAMVVEAICMYFTLTMIGIVLFGFSCVVLEGFTSRKANCEPLWLYLAMHLTSACHGAALFTGATHIIAEAHFGAFSHVVLPVTLVLSAVLFWEWAADDHVRARMSMHKVSLPELGTTQNAIHEEEEEKYEDEQKVAV